jgi:hypothetical protein
VVDFKAALESFLELHVRNNFVARGIAPAVFKRDDADEAEVQRRRSVASQAAGRARNAAKLANVFIGVQGAGVVDPIASWHTMTVPKPLLEPNDVLDACDQIIGGIDGLIFKAELWTRDPWANPWPPTSPAEVASPFDADTIEGLQSLLATQESLLIDVATGGSRIESVKDVYREKKSKLDQGLEAHGITPPFEFDDLWAWYRYWGEHLGSYAERRTFISELASATRKELEGAARRAGVGDPGGTEGPTWKALDLRVGGIISKLGRAVTTDDLQDVGRRCREVLIDLAKLIKDPSLVPAGQEEPKGADAKAWLDLLLATRASGAAWADFRKFVKVAWDLAQRVTHGDVQRVESYAAAQATVLIVRTLQQLVES